MKANNNADTNLLVTHTPRQTFMLCLVHQLSRHTLQSFPNCATLPLTLNLSHCYLHHKVFKTSQIQTQGTIYSCSDKPKHQDYPQTLHAAASKPCSDPTFWCCTHMWSVFYCFVLWLSQRCPHFYLSLPQANLDDTERTHTQHPVTHCAVLYSLVILWRRQKIDATPAYKRTRTTPVIHSHNKGKL